ncbi:MAG: glyoxalase [Bacteroidetes bacterium]|nr:MAG: glyoxalase [Bacteroidota bacterium]
MKLEHIALWAADLEKLREFYEQFFDAESNAKYFNARKQFTSYFLTFPGGARLELMHRPDIPPNQNQPREQYLGLIHFAFELESKAGVAAKAEQLRAAGIPIIDGPRITGDGYFEFTLLDPELNRVEVMCKNS